MLLQEMQERMSEQGRLEKGVAIREGITKTHESGKKKNEEVLAWN
jgi:hypothetical protein